MQKYSYLCNNNLSKCKRHNLLPLWERYVKLLTQIYKTMAKLVFLGVGMPQFISELNLEEKVLSFNIFKKGIRAAQIKGFEIVKVVDGENVIFSTDIKDALDKIRTSVDFFNLVASNEQVGQLKSALNKAVTADTFYKGFDLDSVESLIELEQAKVIEQKTDEQDEQ